MQSGLSLLRPGARQLEQDQIEHSQSEHDENGRKDEIQRRALRPGAEDSPRGGGDNTQNGVNDWDEKLLTVIQLVLCSAHIVYTKQA